MKNPYDRLSRAISYALHPLIVPTIAALLLLFGPTVMSNLPAEARWFIAAVILLNTLILPAFSLAVMKLRLQNQRQRMLPMGIVAVCYMLCILSFRQMTVAFLVDRFLIAALCCVVIAFVVNLYWKISLHMTAAGGLLGMMIVMNYTGLAQFRTVLIVLTVLTGALGSARLQLGSHSLAQVGAGAAAGVAVTAATVLLI